MPAPLLRRIVSSGIKAVRGGGRIGLGVGYEAVSRVPIIGKHIPQFGAQITGTVGATAAVIGGALALRGISGTAQGTYKAIRNTGLINPFFYGRPQHHGYGKRGLDANNQSTDGLVQGLHRNRRSQR